MAASTASISLTDYDREVINKAREVSALIPSMGVLRKFADETDDLSAAYVAFGIAQDRLGDLLNLVFRLTGQ